MFIRRKLALKFQKPFFLFNSIILFFAVLALLPSCIKPQTAAQTLITLPDAEPEDYQGDREAFIDSFWRWTFGDAGLPDELALRTVDTLMEGPDFVMELLEILKDDIFLYALVDKNNPLPANYSPVDMVELNDSAYIVNRSGLLLRLAAAEALDRMAIAARVDGVTLAVSSAYRSYDYQAEVYSRYVLELGAEEADRISAKPGYSQHQLGLVVDFYPVDDAFAATAAGIWMRENASIYGWSLSYPLDYEEVTGYSWESWHYRYIGIELARFIEKYFDGIQQYALQFIKSWMESTWD